jgi:hypothetical protein
MSKRAPDVSVLTANRLIDGIVVFLAPDGRWIETIDGAAVARSADEARALQDHGAHDAARNLVVEPYLAALAGAGARPLPTRMRERMRVEGPSILADVPGYVGANGVRPLAPDVRVSHKRGGEGSGPVSDISASEAA